MITAFRRLFSSTAGKIGALLFLGLIAIAFAAGDIQNLMSGSAPGTAPGGAIARVAGRDITQAELNARVRSDFDQARQDRPTLTMAQFVAGGGVDQALQGLVDGAALDAYADTLGLAVSKRLIDGRIAELPIFQGVTGNFDDARYRDFLQRSGITEGQLRESVRRQLLVEQLGGAMGPPPRVPARFASAYAALQLEQRDGLATFVPSARFAPQAAPTDAQLRAFLSSNAAKYRLPERKIVQFAAVSPSDLPAPTVSDADVAAAYRAAGQRFAASQTRVFEQAILPDQATAQTIAKSGDFAAAVRAAGLSTATVRPPTQAALAATTSAEAATAAFAAPKGSVVGPFKVPLGFVVLRVADVRETSARTLAQATPELRAELTAKGREDQLAQAYNDLQARANSGASAEELAQVQKVTLTTTPPLLADGRIAATGQALPGEVAALLTGVMTAGADGQAQLVALPDGKGFLLAQVKETLPAAPPPFADLRPLLARDWALSEGSKAARDVARKITTAAEKGTPLAAAARSVDARAANVQPITAKRGQLTQLSQAGRVPPELGLLFSMPEGSVRTLELPDNAGWMVLALAKVSRPKAADVPEDLTRRIAGGLQQAVGNESVEQLVTAARAAGGATTNAAALAAFKAELTGQPTP